MPGSMQPEDEVSPPVIDPVRVVQTLRRIIRTSLPLENKMALVAFVVEGGMQSKGIIKLAKAALNQTM